MADSLRLPDETLAMAYIYINRYTRFYRNITTDPLMPDPLDAHTLALASVSLAAKSTESPRRLREILLPAHHLLHAGSQRQQDQYPPSRLKVPSVEYDRLRATLVQAEMLLMRVLGFDLRLPSPLEYVGRYLDRAMREVDDVGARFERWGTEEKKEYGVVDGILNTRLGRACTEKAVDACKHEKVVGLFPARAVAVTCVWIGLIERGLLAVEQKEGWIADVTGGKVDVEDFDEVKGLLCGEEGRTTDVPLHA